MENSRLAAWPRERGKTMKRSKFSESQMAFILPQAEEGTSVDEVCRKAGISQATYLQFEEEVRRTDAV